MTKKRYFMCLWALCSVYPIVKTIKMLTEYYAVEETLFPFFIPILFLIASICMYGFFLSLGMDFAKKIEMRFLLLDTHGDWNRDLFKPAMLMSVLYVAVVLLVNAAMPLASFEVLEGRSFVGLFLKMFSVISHDATMLLFSLSGFAFLLKKIAHNISLSIIMPISIVLIALVNSTDLFWQLGVESLMPQVVIGLQFVMSVMLGMLFWRKGFETALLCHVIIAAMLYVCAPQLILGR